MTSEPEYLPHFRLFVSLRSGISSKKRPLLLKKGPLSGALLPGIQVLQANEAHLLVQSPIVFNGDSMNIVDPIGNRGVQVEIVFSEIRPQANKPSTQHEGEVVGEKDFSACEETPSHTVVSEPGSHIVTDVTDSQAGIGPEHSILKNVFVVVVDIIQSDTEGGVVGSVGFNFSITEVHDEIGRITRHAVCGNVEQATFEVTALASVHQGIAKTKIIFSESGFGIQGKRRDEYQCER
jgi:hypothetical protein